MHKSKWRMFPLVVLAALPLIVTQACKDEILAECEETILISGDFSVGMKFRVEVEDAQSAPVEGVNVRIEYWKVHCEGNDSEHFVEEGQTGAEGIFSTELRAVYRTFYIGNEEALINVQLAAWKEGWSGTSSRVFTYSRLLDLPGTTSGAYTERGLLDSYEFVYSDP